jgi:hypothetical protein
LNLKEFLGLTLVIATGAFASAVIAYLIEEGLRVFLRGIAP